MAGENENGTRKSYQKKCKTGGLNCSGTNSGSSIISKNINKFQNKSWYKNKRNRHIKKLVMNRQKEK